MADVVVVEGVVEDVVFQEGLDLARGELEHMLESVHQYPPISGSGWDLADCHSCFCPWPAEEKLYKLARTKSPTGNPNIPFTVQGAKAVRLLIIEKSEDVTASEEEDIADEKKWRM